MELSATTPREIGRPRLFRDEDIFLATAQVLARVGHEHMTLAAIASEVGCSAPALVQRFGSKNELLRQFMEWSNARVKERFEDAQGRHRSPLATLRSRLTVPSDQWVDDVADPGGYANVLAFYLVAWNHPSLGPIVEERRVILEHGFQDLLVQARAVGELGECDEKVLAEMLLTVFAGVALQWIRRSDGVLEERMGRYFDVLVDPCRP